MTPRPAPQFRNGGSLRDKNELRGTFAARLPSQMVLRVLRLHVKGAARWLGLPAREYLSRGQKHYACIIEFATSDAPNRFHDMVFEALDRYFASCERRSETEENGAGGNGADENAAEDDESSLFR